ncbi:MAG: hypothetical protein M3Q82_01505 [Actinomycetota bacterium]|nr:hypothetical protein [Actinomycetota bacterium]
MTQLQADAFVTLDPDLAQAAEGIVTIASIETRHRTEFEMLATGPFETQLSGASCLRRWL